MLFRSGWHFLTFGRNEGSNTSFAAASSVGGSDGRYQYDYTHTGDFGPEFAASALFKPQETSIAVGEGGNWGGTMPNHKNLPGATTSYDFAFRAFAQDNDTTHTHTLQMFFDLTAMAKLYGPDATSEDSVLDLPCSGTCYAPTEGIGSINLSKLVFSMCNFCGGTSAVFTSLSALPQPTITSFSPSSGLVGSTVTITGTNLNGATQVSFNGTPATSYTVDGPGQITATVPVGATTGTISVVTPGGTVTSSGSFTVVPNVQIGRAHV